MDIKCANGRLFHSWEYIYADKRNITYSCERCSAYYKLPNSVLTAGRYWDPDRPGWFKKL